MKSVVRIFRAIVAGSAIGVAALILLHPVLLHAGEHSWPQWRGPDRDGTAQGPEWPASLKGENLVQTWRVQLGPGYSGPIVTGDRVFVTETAGAEREVVRALDRSNGTELWRAEWEGAIQVPFFARSNGDWIRATPAYDGDSLYVAGMRDVLVCLDGGTGQERWRVDFVRQLGTPTPPFGFVSSPLVVGDHVYVQAGGSFAKLEKGSGKIVWRSLEDGGAMYGSAFSSPVYATIAEVPQLVVQTRSKLAGVAVDSGDVLWSQDVKAFRGMNILTPLVSRDGVFTSSYGGGTVRIGLERAQSRFTPSTQWSDKTEGYMSTPVLIDGHVYLHLRNQRFTCFELASGERKWTSTPFGKYVSLVSQGDRILGLDERGVLLLIRANPERFELLESRTVSSEPTWAHLAVCDGEIFVRELNAVAAYRWKSVPTP